jgi:protein-tyrosine phosphatase
MVNTDETRTDDLFTDRGDGPTFGQVLGPNGDRERRILVVCTGNLCRSPLAAALLARELGNIGIRAVVRSAGTEAINGLPVPRPMVRATGAMLVDLTRHRAVRLEPSHIDDADLVIGMTREHLRASVGLVRASFERTFTLAELARRASRAGNAAGWESWIASLNEGRRSEQLLGADQADDVEDPVGKPMRTHRRIALEIEQLVWQVCDRWPITVPNGPASFAAPSGPL